MRYADLHLHTTTSDGTQTISELVRRASSHGLSSIAITDHDTISDTLTNPVTDIDNIEVITGTEIKASFDGVRGEILGYFIDPSSDPIRGLFDKMKTERARRMKKMLVRCEQQTGLSFSMVEMREIAKGSIGRPHLAQLLIDKGAVSSLREAFDTLLANEKPCYVPLEKPDYRVVASAIYAAGGVSSLAHPCLMNVSDWGKFLADVQDNGINGIEVFYPYNCSPDNLSISPTQLEQIARKSDFVLTGGSDDHGPGSVKDAIGEIKVPYKYVQALQDARNIN